jgi:hypothetical protein
MKKYHKDAPRSTRRLAVKRGASAAFVVVLMLASGMVSAGENTKPVSIACASKPGHGSPSVDPLGYGYKLIVNAAKNKKMDMEKLEALGEVDMLLTSSYGLRKPLATITNRRAADQMALTSQLTMSGYVIAAQMMFGIVRKEALIPERTAYIAGNMIYTMTEPDDHDPSLTVIADKIKKADKEISGLAPEQLSYARWLIRGYAFNDPVAVEAAMVGFCDSKPTNKAKLLVEGQAKKVRLDPRKIAIIKG